MDFRKKVTICGIEFELKTLTYEQDQMISSFPGEQEDPLAFYEKTRAHILAYSICRINGEEIPNIVRLDKNGTTEIKEKSIYLKEVIKNFSPKVVEKLFEIYIDFKDEVDSKLESGVEYVWFKTPEQRKKEREESQNKTEEKTELSTENKSEEAPIIFTPIVEKEEKGTAQQ